jgi:hypothetical protein
VVNAHGLVAGAVGCELPAVSISWEKPQAPRDSGLLVIFSNAGDETPVKPMCLHCLIEEGDEDLGRGLDLARKFGHVDFDFERGEWFTPEERAFPGELGWEAELTRV